jgi:hypothetical protein
MNPSRVQGDSHGAASGRTEGSVTATHPMQSARNPTSTRVSCANEKGMLSRCGGMTRRLSCDVIGPTRSE